MVCSSTMRLSSICGLHGDDTKQVHKKIKEVLERKNIIFIARYQMQLKTLILESRGLLSSENRLFAQINEDDISIFSLDLLIFFEEHRT